MTASMVMPEQARIAQRFGDAAHAYDAEALAQRHSAAALLTGIRAKGRALDVGCGTGWLAGQLAAQPEVTEVLALDIARPMLQSAVRMHPSLRCIQADAAAMPVASGSIDLLVSNFALQWLSSPDRFASELYRVLAAQGCFRLAVPVAGTLGELSAAWERVEENPPINRFLSSGAWAETLLRHNLKIQTQAVTPLFQYYPTVRELLRAFKRIGANETLSPRRSGMWGKGKLQALESAMEPYRTLAGLPLRYDVLLITGYKP